MKTVGLITEYNPFHNGHLYHLNAAGTLTGSDGASVVMSGDFTQRGYPAIVDKYARTRMALEAGADAVFELPVYHALGSAERFAEGAIGALNALGAVNSIVYGCERVEGLDGPSDVVVSKSHSQGIETLARLFLEEPESFKELLSVYLKQGVSFPAARAKAVNELYPEYGKLLDLPNNILAIEYEKAIIKSGSTIKSGGIIRSDAGYLESGTEIRRAIFELDYNAPELDALMPETSIKQLKYHMEIDLFSDLMNYKLLTSDVSDLIKYEDISEDIAQRILRLRDRDYSFTELVDHLTTRNITETRARRVLMHVLLEIRKRPSSEYTLPYVRLLGCRKDSKVMKEIKKKAFLPIISKLADAPVGFWEEDDRATRIYNQVVRKNFGYDLQDDYRNGPVIL